MMALLRRLFRRPLPIAPLTEPPQTPINKEYERRKKELDAEVNALISLANAQVRHDV